MNKTHKILNHIYFLLIAGLAVAFADIRTLNDASLYLKVNSLFFADGLSGLFASGVPKISATIFSLIAILPAYIIFLFLQYGLKRANIVNAFLITLSCSSVLFSKPYTFFETTYIAQGVPVIIVVLRVCMTCFLEILLWGIWTYNLFKQGKLRKAFLLLLLFPAGIVAVFCLFDLAGIIKYADFAVIAVLFFFNISALKNLEVTSRIFGMIFYVLLVISLFTYSQQLLPEKKKIDFFESTYTALENKGQISYYDAREAEISPLILQRYGNKQINSEFLTYSLFKHQKSIVVLFPQGEIIDALKKENINYENVPQEMFSYKTVKSYTWFADSTLASYDTISSIVFNWYIPVLPLDSIYISIERKGSNNGFIMIMGYDNRRVPSFIAWENMTEYFKKNMKHEENREWHLLEKDCFIPPKTEELRFYINSSVGEEMYFRNLKIEVRRSEIRF
jgi:hypothetical protein